MHQKAAALLHGIATSHAFIDGNKRSALPLTYLLIDRSGFDLVLRQGDEFDDVIVDVVNHAISEAELAGWFRERLVRVR
jgi:death-on-curing protein